jgi:hypothetical protein
MVAEGVDAETGEVAESAFPEVRIDRKFVIQQQGRDFVLSDGLLDGLHQLSRGFFEVETKIEQLPTAENGQTAVVSAVVTVFAPYDGRVLRRASDIGDASPASVGRNIAPHLIRMASTRAVSRSLRTLLNEGSVAYEELGGDDAPAPAATRQEARPASFSAPVVRGPAESIQVDGRAFSRAQVLDVYHARLREADAAGLALAPIGEQGGPPPDDAPLLALVGFSQSIKRRLDARSGAVHANGAGGK